MCFNHLYESAKRDELILIDGGMCHYHVRRDGQLTIREVISLRPGAGTEMLEMLKEIGIKKKLNSIFAKCPEHLESNDWYHRRGFAFEGAEVTRSGGKVNHWRLTKW